MIWRGNTTVEARDGGIASGRDTNIDIHIHEVHQTAKAAFAVPSPVNDFTGRVAELERVVRGLRGGGTAMITASVSGMGGVGKTQLAQAAAQRLADVYPDGQILIDLFGTTDPLTPERAMSDVIQALDPQAKPPDAPGPLHSAYAGALRGKRLLLVLDNAENGAQVQPLLPGPPTGVIVTSRQTLSLPGATPVPLDTLTRGEAVQLLAGMLPDAKVADLDRLAEACGDLPLALRLAGSYLAEMSGSVTDYLSDLAEARLDRFEADASDIGRNDLNVRRILGYSIVLLERDASDLAARWRSLAVFPTDFDADAAAAVWACEAKDARREVARLVRRSLVNHDAGTTRYRLHDLLRDTARATVDHALLAVSERRHAAYFAELIGFANHIYDNVDELKGLILFDLERKNIESGRKHAKTHMVEDNNSRKALWLYALHGANVVDIRLTRQQEYEWLKDGYAAARDADDISMIADCANNFASVAVRMGREEEANHFFCEALSCYDKLRDISKIVSTKYNYATFFKDIGCVKIAREEAQKAEIVLYENIDNLSLKTIANCRILHCMILASYHDEKEERVSG